MSNAEEQSILLVLPWSPTMPGGVSVVVRMLAQKLRGHNPKPVIVVNTWEANRSAINVEGVSQFRFALLGSTKFTGLAKLVLTAPQQLRRIKRFLDAGKVQAVNFHYPSHNALGIAILKLLHLYKGRLILSFHGTDVRTPVSTVEKYIWQFIFAATDVITTCSRALATEVVNAYCIPISRITVIYNGVDTKTFNPDAASNSSNFDLPERYIVSVGSYMPRKGHRILLDAFSRLAGEFSDIGLVIVGMDGNERLPLLDYAKQLGLQQRLTCLVGLNPETVASIVARAQVCVQASFAEPFGLAVIEAGACGIPVIATAVGGHVELLKHLKTGYLFSVGDVAECMSLLRLVLEDSKSSAIVAQRFRSEILKRYTWETCANQYFQLLSGKSVT